MFNNGSTWIESPGWTATTSNQEDTSTTGKQNAIILQNSAGLGLPSGAEVKVLFFATNTNYITNPGTGYFFVKINTFNDFPALGVGNTLYDNVNSTSNYVIDGGVTVANVMNQSIQITTRVLETMQFSVGTVDPDTLSDAQLADTSDPNSTHLPCDTVLTGMTPTDSQDVLQLGDTTQESALSTTTTFATHSYWRLSSNSSAGATVYYSGHTLSDTSGDEITPIGTTASVSTPGAEQFGLALDTTSVDGSTGIANLDNGSYGVDYSTDGAGVDENAADNDAAGVLAANTAYAADLISDPGNFTAARATGNGVDPSVLSDNGVVLGSPNNYTALNKSYHTPKLNPLVPVTGYGGGAGTITGGGTAEFAFDSQSDTVPAPIATESSQVVDCVTGKMRYIANIAATTPAGIYTTKVNYIAAPQY